MIRIRNTELMKKHRNTNFIIITSSAPRSGTTIMHKIFSTSDKTFVFSEDSSVFSLCLGMKELIEELNHKKHALEKVREDILSNEAKGWIEAVLPDPLIYLEKIFDSFYKFMESYTLDELSLNKQFITIKVPARTIEQMKAFRVFFPNTKIIYLRRNALDVAKSLISYKEKSNYASFQQTMARWCNIEKSLDEPKENNTFIINYDDLRFENKALLTDIEDFCWETSFNWSMLKTKINSKTGYISPGELSYKHIDILKNLEKEESIRIF